MKLFLFKKKQAEKIISSSIENIIYSHVKKFRSKVIKLLNKIQELCIHMFLNFIIFVFRH